MKRITVIRVNSRANSMNGTAGVMLDDGVPFANTIEDPWNDNKPFISCILPGFFKCVRYSSKKHPDTFLIKDTPGRDLCLFHVANTIKDVEGCIGVGEEFGLIDGKLAVLGSGRGFAEFLQRTAGLKEFELEIREVW